MDKKSKSAAFFKLFMAEQKAIYAYILSMVHNVPDADDILQETATLMWEKFDEFEAGTNFGAWGTTISRYKILDYYRNRKSKTSENFDDELANAISECAQKKLCQMSDRMSALQECLKKLSEQDRKLLQIRYEQNLKISDIAQRISRPVQGLYKAMARIHSVLHRCVNSTMLTWRVR